MARNARWIAPIMIAMESVIFGRICASVAKCFLHFLQCQVFKTPLDLSLTNGQSLLVMKSSCFQTVAQRSIWWPNWTIHGPKFVQLMFNTINTYGIFFTKKIFKPLFTLLVMLSSCSQKVAKANPGWNQLRRTGKSSTGLQLLSAETPVSKSTFSSWPSYYQKAASFSKSCKGQFRLKPIE